MRRPPRLRASNASGIVRTRTERIVMTPAAANMPDSRRFAHGTATVSPPHAFGPGNAAARSNPNAAGPVGESSLLGGFLPKSIVVSGKQDTAFRRGDTDNNGDHKGANAVLRLKNGLLVGGEIALDTPQKGGDRKLHDTATVKTVFGYETQNWGLYGIAGLANGKMANGIVYRAIDGYEGSAKYRKSPVKKATAIFGVQGRYDAEAARFAVGTLIGTNVVAIVHGSGYGELSTVGTRAGAMAFLTFQAADAPSPRHDLRGLPKQDGVRGNVYAAGGVEVRGAALATHRPGTEKIIGRVAVGATYPITDNVAVFAEVAATTPDARGAKGMPVGIITVGIKGQFGSSASPAVIASEPEGTPEYLRRKRELDVLLAQSPGLDTAYSNFWK